ncbi:hypothetical protein PENSPDRAFT_101597 [Peniophora sp. CONT]|nr:hypothetical protein PENSPDRAFT_101597 [Peniophora sp. CONT]
MHCSTDHPTTIDKNRTHYVCRSWQASSFNLYHWSDWPFMIKLTHDRWSSTSIGELVAFNMSEAVEMEQLLGSLEEMKRDLWKAYALGNPEEALVLVESELPKAYEERAGELRPETRSFMAMQQLSRRRSRKAPAFDRLRMGGRAHPDASNIIGERFWAVVVGIDQYLNASGLSGCVNDANLMVDFLTSTLRVPGSHIVVLASSTSTTTDELQSKVRPIGVPSRAVILDALHSHFRDNDSVRYGDNLIFYFSGHGSSYGLFGPSATETVCPMDRGTTSSPRIYDISDRELNIIFSEIRDSKGPNLTVILDCCHTASHTHTLAHDPTVRALPPLNDPDAERCMFESAANDVRRQPDARSPLSPSWKGDMTSHVLLAACKPGESARELDVPRGTYPRLGVFTFALVSALRSPRGVDPALTYFNLIKSVIDHPESQTPVVAGKRKRERLWFQEGPLIEPTVLIRD